MAQQLEDRVPPHDTCGLLDYNLTVFRGGVRKTTITNSPDLFAHDKIAFNEPQGFWMEYSLLG
jgi:hypothetical protein